MMKLSRTPDPNTVPGARKRMKRNKYAYVRTHRRRWGLTQKELGWLLGVANRTAVSRIEMSKRKPPAECLVACAILFDLPLEEIFPGFHGEIEHGIFLRVTTLRERLAERTDDLSLRKCAFLDQVLCRITNRLQPPPS